MSLSFCVGKVKISMSFWFFAVMALFALLDHQALLYYIALPVAIHELGHLLCLAACRVPIREIRFTPVSINIKTAPRGLSYSRDLAIAAAGVVANLLTALILWRFAFQSMRTILMIASHLAVAFFNLLPVGNLDGGQMVRILCCGVFAPATARSISLLVSFAVLVPLTALAVWLFLRGRVNFTLALTCLYLIVTVILQE